METSNVSGHDLADSLRNVADILDNQSDVVDPRILDEVEYLVNELVDVIMQEPSEDYLDYDDEDY